MVPGAPKARWLVACPDVFSLRHTSVEAYLQPTVHEIKVSRADLLGDLKRPDKRAAYLQMGGACWYVLGRDAKGRAIASPEEVPPECGVMQWEADDRLAVLRPAPRRTVERLPFHVWMALARATPPGVQAITLQTTLQNGLTVSDLPGPTGGIMLKSATGATLIVNDTGIYIQNGKGASLIMTGPTTNINAGALTVV